MQFYGEGFCRKHFTRLKRGKNPFEKSREEKSLFERMEERIVRVPESGCWLWIGNLNNNGYGKIEEKYAHRVSYEIEHGPIPDGKFVLHSCDVTCCVNPNHLRLGSQKDNMQDAVERGRTARGSKLPQYRHGLYSKYKSVNP
jgi:hypothetical protein